jgi:hypothetical protein
MQIRHFPNEISLLCVQEFVLADIKLVKSGERLRIVVSFSLLAIYMLKLISFDVGPNGTPSPLQPRDCFPFVYNQEY